MISCEEELWQRLKELKERYGLLGVKAEFEAEGSTFDDVARLRRMTSTLGVALVLKIGGVEAFRDMKDSVTLGVDGIVAPMAESAFGVRKFVECSDKLYARKSVRKAINIETRDSIANLDSILAECKGKIDGITIGRTDLSASWLDRELTPDSDFIMTTVRDSAIRSAQAGFEVTVGGSITKKTVAIFKEMPELSRHVNALETRKVILPRDVMLSDEGDDALKAALAFETAWITCKCAIAELFLQDERERLAKLAMRA